MENLCPLCGLLWEIGVIGFLAGWFLLAVLYQFRRGAWSWLGRWDPLRLVPRWTFFAPHPGGTDLHLFYRGLAADGNAGDAGDWIEIPLGRRRQRKVLLDALRALFTLAKEVEDPRSLQITVPYLLLLRRVSSEAVGESSPSSAYRQFQITESFGFFPEREPQEVFRSEIHALG